MSVKKDHSCNQSDSHRSSKIKKMWDFILDNQYKCDVIANEKTLKRIRKCNWTLRLQTQTGEYVINQIGELIEVRTV